MAHNGGVTQLGMSHRQFGGDYPFANCFKNGQGWSSNDNVTPIDDSKHDDNGWPTEIYGNGQRDFFAFPLIADRPGNYIIEWDNDGTVAGEFTLVSGSLSSSITRRAEVSVSANPADHFIDLGITAHGAVPLTNLRFYHADDEDGIKNHGQIFGTKFLQRLHAMKPGALRFMDSLNGNESSARYWSNVTPVDHYTWSAPYRQKSLFAGVSTNSGNDYSCTLSGFALVHGAQVIFRVNNTASAGDCRLNVSGTGLYPLKDPTVNLNGSDTIPFSVSYPTAGWNCCAMFDANLECYIMHGGSTAQKNGSFYRGWPPSIMIALCNEIGAHLSIPVPRFAANKDCDFLEEFATLAKNTLDSGLKFQVEGPNETWNTASGFMNTYYASNSESDASTHQWYGRAISQMGDTLEEVFPGGKGVDYDLDIGIYAGFNPSGDVLNRFDSARYVTETGNASDAAYLKATRIVPANYWTTSKIGQQEETDAADAYDSAADDEERAAIVDAYMTLYAEPGLQAMFVKMATWSAYAATKGLVIAGYEGGYSPDYTGDVTVDTFRAATKSWPGLYYLTCKMYRTFMKIDGGQFPAAYYFSGPGAWSVLDPDIYAADSPQYTAIVDTNAGKWPFRFTSS